MEAPRESCAPGVPTTKDTFHFKGRPGIVPQESAPDARCHPASRYFTNEQYGVFFAYHQIAAKKRRLHQQKPMLVGDVSETARVFI